MGATLSGQSSPEVPRHTHEARQPIQRQQHPRLIYLTQPVLNFSDTPTVIFGYNCLTGLCHRLVVASTCDLVYAHPKTQRSNH